MTTATPDAPATLSLAERLTQRETEALASFDPTVPGIPGDGSPVLLHTDPDRGLTYTWYDVSRRVQDFTSRKRGFLVSRLVVTHASGHEVASLNVTHTTKELFAAQFANAFEWADANTGASFGFKWAREEGRTVSPEQVWASAYNHLRERPPSARTSQAWTLEPSDAPTDPAVLAAELAAAEKVFARQMRGMVRWLSTPFVDYAHVDDAFDAQRAEGPGHPGNLRGTGIGRQMYLLAAQHLASQRKVLRASGVQTGDAERLWQRLVADPAVPTRKTRQTFYKPTENPTASYWCLDFTATPSA